MRVNAGDQLCPPPVIGEDTQLIVRFWGEEVDAVELLRLVEFDKKFWRV